MLSIYCAHTLDLPQKNSTFALDLHEVNPAKLEKTSMKKKLIITISTLTVLLLIAAAVCIEQYYRLEVCNFSARNEQGHGYYVYPNTSADSLLTLLKNDYDIASEASFHLHARHLHFHQPKPGYYHFPVQIGDKHLIRRLQLGEQTPVRLTFTQSIRTRAQLSGAIARQLLLDSTSIKQRLDSVSYLQRYGLTPETAVCLFLPNTYEVYWTISPDQLFDRMHREYKHFWNETRLAKAQKLSLTPAQVTTIASIIESETNKAFEYPTIASIYINRLRKGIPLQACPTVIFAVGDFSMHRVLKRHLKIDSPYNTYKYPGLPPGPIRLARPTVIDAVLDAPQTDYLYMCANPDFSGTHIFSSSYSKHAATARRYQQELNKRHIVQ